MGPRNEHTAITLRLPTALLEQARAAARARGQMPLAAYIRLAVMEKLEREALADKRRSV